MIKSGVAKAGLATGITGTVLGVLNIADYCAELSAELMEKWKELEERFLNNC